VIAPVEIRAVARVDRSNPIQSNRTPPRARESEFDARVARARAIRPRRARARRIRVVAVAAIESRRELARGARRARRTRPARAHPEATTGAPDPKPYTPGSTGRPTTASRVPRPTRARGRRTSRLDATRDRRDGARRGDDDPACDARGRNSRDARRATEDATRDGR
jgi:hypothetical protein